MYMLVYSSSKIALEACAIMKSLNAFIRYARDIVCNPITGLPMEAEIRSCSRGFCCRKTLKYQVNKFLLKCHLRTLMPLCPRAMRVFGQPISTLAMESQHAKIFKFVGVHIDSHLTSSVKVDFILSSPKVSHQDFTFTSAKDFRYEHNGLSTSNQFQQTHRLSDIFYRRRSDALRTCPKRSHVFVIPDSHHSLVEFVFQICLLSMY